MRDRGTRPVASSVRVPNNRIVSIQTTSERGGAEYANVDLLEALRQRGHDVLLVTNVPDIAAKTGVPVLPIDLGPKLSKRSVGLLLLRSPQNLLKLIGVLRRTRPRDQLPPLQEGGAAAVRAAAEAPHGRGRVG